MIRPESRGRSATPKGEQGDPQERALATLDRGRREDRVRAAPAVSRANTDSKAHTSIQVQRKQSGLPCAMVLTVSFVLSPVTGLIVTVISKKLASQKLDASTGASGPHDFAVRFSAVRQKRLRVHRIPCPTSVTIAIRPSCGTGCTE
jgi:hypothetical protein